MIFLRKFNDHTSYETELNGGGVDISLPNVSYCEDVKDVHFNPYNTVEFYVGEITGTTQHTVSIYTDNTNHLDVQVSEGNKWYSYLLPKNKGLYSVEGDSVKKVVVKADISFEGSGRIIPKSTVEASFKGSDTSNVTLMDRMFANCSVLTSLDLSSFNTSNVTEMALMFRICANLTSLDLSSFDTSKVTSMGGMFRGCSGLISLDLSSFNTSNVTDMGQMFLSCSGLKSLDLSGFDTSNVNGMSQMFKGCSGLTSLDLSGWDTTNVINMDSMFYGCATLKTITMKGCSEATRTKIQSKLTTDGITGATITT